MPPQVGSAKEGTRPVVPQITDVEQPKSSDLEKKAAEQQSNLSDSSTTQTHRASPEEKTGRLKELSVRGDTTKATLNSKLNELNTEESKKATANEKMKDQIELSRGYPIQQPKSNEVEKKPAEKKNEPAVETTDRKDELTKTSSSKQIVLNYHLKTIDYSRTAENIAAKLGRRPSLPELYQEIKNQSPAVLAEEQKRLKEKMTSKEQHENMKRASDARSELQQTKADTQTNIARKR